MIGDLKIFNRKETSESVFASLFKKYGNSLYLFTFKITKSKELSADIVQEVFMKLWEHREKLDSIENLEGWLHRAAKNKLIDSLRKTAADKRLRDSLWSNLQDPVSDVEQEMDARECNRLIQDAINRLPKQRKIVFQLNREEGLNYQEIAEHLSISRHTVKNQVSMALQTVQQLLTGTIAMLMFTL